MKILLVTEYFPDSDNPNFLGGVQARTFFIASFLRKNHEVGIISHDQGNIEANTSSMFSRITFFFRIVGSRIRHKPDIIEASNVTTYFPAFILAKRLGVPAIAWIPDILEKSWFTYFSFPVAISGYLMEKISLKLPWNRIIAMSNATKDKLIKSGIKPSAIDVIYGGVEYQQISSLMKTKYATPTICSIARLVPYKRHCDLIDAVKIIKKDKPDINCLIIGEGPEKQKLLNQIDKLGLHGSVELLGNRNHKSAMEVLSKSHLFSLPSLVEGFGIVTVEAMAAGVPFVNSGIAATLEITRNGKGGLLYQPGNYQELASKILKLFSNVKLYQQKQKEGIGLAKSYDWAIIARQTLESYEKAINEK